MKKARKKPVVIEYIQFTDEAKDEVFSTIRHECNCWPSFDENENPTLVIGTLEGEMTVSLSDFVIKGVMGEFYPCKPDIFAMTYELVEEDVNDD